MYEVNIVPLIYIKRAIDIYKNDHCTKAGSGQKRRNSAQNQTYLLVP
jgi:hypothetical protein